MARVFIRLPAFFCLGVNTRQNATEKSCDFGLNSPLYSIDRELLSYEAWISLIPSAPFTRYRLPHSIYHVLSVHVLLLQVRIIANTDIYYD